MIATLLKAGKIRILAATVALLALIGFADWSLGHNITLAALYILPMMTGALVLRPVETAAFAVVCSYLRGCFTGSGSSLEQATRFVFAALAYLISGLFVTELVRNHKLVIEHFDKIRVEQGLRREAEEQVRVLAESSPAAILTVDGRGTVLAANGAANSLFAIPDGKTLQGCSIRDYLPVLADALRLDIGSAGLRTAAQCQGRRENGEIFLAHTWFSSYSAPEGLRLAAIVVDSSEEMRDREEQGLRQLLRGNRIAAAAVAHEVHNFCGAMALLCGNLGQRHGLAQDEDLRGLANLAGGLEAIAAFELQSKTQETIQQVPLREVLDDLRIVIEPGWREIEGTVRWFLPEKTPAVLAEAHGLLQAFLNLAQNSHRAVQEGSLRELSITVAVQEQKVVVRFEDSGPGIAAAESLFQPFQQGASGSGLGLYVSRFIVRSYGGELRFEPRPKGSCFVIELQAV